MSKRPNSPNEAPPIKRIRLRPGFRLARPDPVASQATPPLNTSLFVTVSQPDERRGILQAQNRILSSTPAAQVAASDLSTPPPPSTSESDVPPPPEPDIDIQDQPAPQGEEQTVNPTRKRNTATIVCYHTLFWAQGCLNPCQDRLTEWLKFREIFLDETLRHDGLGDFLDHSKCSNCGTAEGVIKCKDCSCGTLLKCPQCIVSLHRTLPLHRVEVRPRVF